MQRRLTRGLTVFLYHDVTNEPSDFARDYDIYVSVETFRRQIAWISKHYQVVHPELIAKGGRLPDNAALITFDDGFHGAFEHGLPILAERELSAIVFLNLGAVIERRPLIAAHAAYLERFVPSFAGFAKNAGAERPFLLSLTPRMLARYETECGLPPLDAITAYQGSLAEPATLDRWASSERVAFGNHFLHHWNSPALTDAEFVEQYQGNETALAAYPNRLPMVAFPNGRFEERHLALLKKHGTARAFCSSGGTPRDLDAFLLDRCGLGDDNTEAQLWLSALRARRSGPPDYAIQPARFPSTFLS